MSRPAHIDMFTDTDKALEIIWGIIHEHSETAWGDRIGRGYHEKNDNEYAAEYEEVCEAMAAISEALDIN